MSKRKQSDSAHNKPEGDKNNKKDYQGAEQKCNCVIIDPAEVFLYREWEKYKIKFEKKYKCPEEDARRKEIFKKTLDEVTRLNEDYEQKNSGYKATFTEMADLTDDEKKKISGNKT